MLKVLSQTQDSIPKDSYDNFKNKPNPYGSYAIIKDKKGIILFETNTIKGICDSCYAPLIHKADSAYKRKDYSTASIMYASAFTLNDNKGKVKDRINAACAYTELSDFDSAFDNLSRVVFGAKLRNTYAISSNKCFKPLQGDARWKLIIDGLNQNVNDFHDKLNEQ